MGVPVCFSVKGGGGGGGGGGVNVKLIYQFNIN